MMVSLSVTFSAGDRICSPVHAYTASLDHALRLAAGGDTGTGQNFGDPVAFRGLFGGIVCHAARLPCLCGLRKGGNCGHEKAWCFDPTCRPPWPKRPPAGARGEVPVGAVVVDPAGQVVARAGNRTRELNDPTAHAEVLAIRAACAAAGSERLPDHALYVTLEPCPMCAAAISAARVARLFYGASDPKSGGGRAGGTGVFPIRNVIMCRRCLTALMVRRRRPC